ncbi:MAG: Mur ligase family protein, partial [Gammaproteobacteria bacterium]|nr:Mur ligase family protein [Gammaproteobacteria bacterium]
IDDPGVRNILSRLHRSYVTYGFSDEAEFKASEFSQTGLESSFVVFRNDQLIGEFKLALPGRHNVLNALAVIATGFKLGVPLDVIRIGLSNFEGISRRFEILGKIQLDNHTVELVDDYAHHPMEIAVTLKAAQGCWPKRRIVVVFQPHRYSRTRDLFHEFVQILGSVPALVITEVYAAGEKPIPGYDGKALTDALRSQAGTVEFAETTDDLNQILQDISQPDDVVITMGAGNIGQYAVELFTKLAVSSHNLERAYV